MSDTDMIALLVMEHGWKCREGGLSHRNFGDSGTRRVKMDNQARVLLRGPLASMQDDLIGDAHQIYARRIVAGPAPFVRGIAVDSGRVDGFVLRAMALRANWYYRLPLACGGDVEGHADIEDERSLIPSDESEARESLRQELYAAVRSLPPGLRIPLNLHLEGKTTSEIVEEMHLTGRSVKDRIRKAIEILRRRMANRDDMRDLLPG